MRFQEIGLLRQMDTYQRNRRFIYSDYLAMFVDEELPRNDRKMVLEGNEEDRTQFLT